MFDLNQAIDNWRAQLGRADGCLGDDAAELEEHLREEMAGLAQAGLTEEEAFLLSARRLGRADLLGEEFAKVNAPSILLGRLHWMGAGVLIWMASGVAASFAGQVSMIEGFALGFHPHVVGGLTVVARLGVLVVLIALALGILVVRERLVPRSIAGRYGLLVGIVLWFVLLLAGSSFCPAVAIRMCGPAEFGQASIVTAIGALATSILAPILLAGWVLITARRLRAA
ncbi:MAG: hypothetical protein JW888_17220 [Pirellulales bacterium]|nr:hypothetical protein [Pirellulales bacterium]